MTLTLKYKIVHKAIKVMNCVNVFIDPLVGGDQYIFILSSITYQCFPAFTAESGLMFLNLSRADTVSLQIIPAFSGGHAGSFFS